MRCPHVCAKEQCATRVHACMHAHACMHTSSTHPPQCVNTQQLCHVGAPPTPQPESCERLRLHCAVQSIASDALPTHAAPAGAHKPRANAQQRADAQRGIESNSHGRRRTAPSHNQSTKQPTPTQLGSSKQGFFFVDAHTMFYQRPICCDRQVTDAAAMLSTQRHAALAYKLAHMAQRRWVMDGAPPPPQSRRRAAQGGTTIPTDMHASGAPTCARDDTAWCAGHTRLGLVTRPTRAPSPKPPRAFDAPSCAPVSAAPRRPPPS